MTWHFEPAYDICVPARKDWLSILSLLTCISISVVSCVATLVRSACGSLPGSVQRRNYLRALSYIVVVLISYSTITVVYLHIEWAIECRALFTVACILEISNGFLNSAVYAKQSYGATKERGRLLTAAAIDGPRPMRKIPNEDTAADAAVPADLASIHVEFGGVDVLELLLPAELAWTESSLGSSLPSEDPNASSGSHA